MWGSEFTLKNATLQGGSIRNRSYAERKVVGFEALLVVVASYGFLAQSYFLIFLMNQQGI